MKGRNASLVFIIMVLVLGVVAWQYRNSPWLAPLLGSNTTADMQTQVGKTWYACDDGKTITATFYQGAASSVQAGSSSPPAPNGSAALMLSDGRSMTLPQTISASGIRYAADNSLVFWSKGSTAFITEGANQTRTYANCIAASNIVGQESWKTFASPTDGYSVRYPAGYAIDASYVYQALGPGKDILGTKFTIPESMATGTNLAADTYVSIEKLPKATSCTADKFLDTQIGTTTTSADNGTTYSLAKGGGAGAGNLYAEYVYAIPGTSPCLAVRYFIHSGQIGNYPPGTVKVFDQSALLSEFDGIRRSLVLGR